MSSFVNFVCGNTIDRGFRRSARSGFTLIELVVVLTILGLAASIVTIRFAGPLREARVRAAIEQWRATDQVARLANRSGRVTVTLNKLGNRTQITVQSDSGQILRRWPVDAPLNIELANVSGVAMNELVFESMAGSQDYRITVREATFSRSLDFAGGTGCVRTDKSK